MNNDHLIGLHASVITVLSMQFIVIFSSGLYDPWDFIVSLVCFLFGVRLYRMGYEEGLGRLLISANVAISFVFLTIYPLAYFVEFWQIIVLKAGPNDFFAPARYLEGGALDFLELGYNSTVTRGEVISLFLVFFTWLFARPSAPK